MWLCVVWWWEAMRWCGVCSFAGTCLPFRVCAARLPLPWYRPMRAMHGWEERGRVAARSLSLARSVGSVGRSVVGWRRRGERTPCCRTIAQWLCVCFFLLKFIWKILLYYIVYYTQVWWLNIFRAEIPEIGCALRLRRRHFCNSLKQCTRYTILSGKSRSVLCVCVCVCFG